MPEELCQVSPKSHYGVLASHSDPSPFGQEFWAQDYVSYFLGGNPVCITVEHKNAGEKIDSHNLKGDPD